MDPRLEAAAAKLQAGDLTGARALLAEVSGEPNLPPADRAQALCWLADLALLGGQPDEAEAYLGRALRLARRTPNPAFFRLQALARLTALALSRRRLDEAEQLAQRRYRLARRAAGKLPDQAPVFWELAVDALRDRAAAALERRDLDGYVRRLRHALRLAGRAGLEDAARQLESELWRFRLGSDPAARTALEAQVTRLKDAGRRFELYCLRADLFEAEGDLQAALTSLETALATAPAATDRARLLCRLGRLRLAAGGPVEAAVRDLEQAARLGEELGNGPLVREALTLLIQARMLAGESANELLLRLRQLLPPEEYAWALLAAAYGLYRRNPTAALGLVSEARRHAGSWLARTTASLAEAAVLRRLGRLQDACRAVRRGIALVEAQPTDPTRWRDLLAIRAQLYEAEAVLLARLGRPAAALRTAEGAKAQILRRRLGLAPPDPARLRSWLAAQEAACVYLCVQADETLVLLLEPGSYRPQVRFAPVGEDEVAFGELPGPAAFNRLIFDKVLPRVSAGLAQALDEVSRQVRLLYLVPDSRLCAVPFAALRFPDGSRLADRCAVALLPGSALLARPANPNRPQARSLLAAGWGGVREYDFAPQAVRVAALPGWGEAEALADPPLADWLSRAPRHRVLFVAAHGDWNPPRLLCGPAGEVLTAEQVETLRLGADLVFINACVSAVFPSQVGAEVGGFWEAFFLAGARALVGTVAYVPPDLAERVAVRFFEGWLSGLTAAEALRRAQLEVRPTCGDEMWAAHILAGRGDITLPRPAPRDRPVSGAGR